MQNTFCWVDIPCNSLERAISFYSAVLAQPVQLFDEHGYKFGLLPHVETNVSGCLCEMPDRKPSQSGPLVYLNVEGRLDAAIEAARKAGAQIIKEKEQIGPYGHRALIVDSEGNGVALYSKEA
ncbi:glycoxylase [Legionella adelaidensis]|uniref:Glycoxylase n=1 Tax=Legionella adelaidensis TaxID=45056 RepID=A0A0W0R6H6_9GAMM|nr:VOC family protein [Legionella adelaidensis]KTC66629.1 glyoxylase [Legionella adelaidensis]VEH81037.1 glycoxylase [Legionella adelaidensis]